jgi:uncharacterized membrane protein YkoI
MRQNDGAERRTLLSYTLPRSVAVQGGDRKVSSMRIVAAIFAAGLLGLAPAVSLAQDHGRDHDRGGHDARPHGGPAPSRGRPGGGGGGNGGGTRPYERPGPMRGGPGPVIRGGGGGGPGYGRPHVSLDGVISQMHHRFPGGRLLDAQVEDRGGRSVYRVRWSTGDGRRIDYFVDAETGAIIGEED